MSHFLIAWIVLATAAVADGVSLVQTLRQARREAALWNTSTLGYLRGTSEPTLRALSVEDPAALVGVTIAAIGLLADKLGGPPQINHDGGLTKLPGLHQSRGSRTATPGRIISSCP